MRRGFATSSRSASKRLSTFHFPHSVEVLHNIKPLKNSFAESSVQGHCFAYGNERTMCKCWWCWDIRNTSLWQNEQGFPYFNFRRRFNRRAHKGFRRTAFYVRLGRVRIHFVVEVADCSLDVSHVADSIAWGVYTSVCTVVAGPSCIRRLSWFGWFGVEACDKTLNVSHGADTIWNTACWTSVVEPAVIHFPHCIVIVARIKWIKIPSFYPVLTPSSTRRCRQRQTRTISHINPLQIRVHLRPIRSI